MPNAPEAVMVEVNGFRYRVGDQVVREPQEVISRRKGQAELKNADYRDMFRLSRYAAVRELRRLADEGFLRIEGERRGTRYLPHAALGVARE
ncbi:MAG TPA: hypothetical protein VMT79_15360 [Candidatus Binatia bacterium]|nr:hypothetical protein [Candidatus Binatia bacterium]